MKQVGFTGTRQGMTKAQIESLEKELAKAPFILHHGDCIGADAQAHTIARALKAHIVGHPPNNSKARAYCQCDELREEKPYLERNRAIVLEVDEMLAAPKEKKDVRRSGSWYTIRHCKMVGKALTIIWPDGQITHKEN